MVVLRRILIKAMAADPERRYASAADFAAELLMPSRLFSADVEGKEPSFELVEKLAAPDYYDVSLTAAAWRVIQTTSEACALVVTAGAKVEWIARSRSFRYAMAEREQRVSSGTVAAAVFAGEAPGHGLERVDWHAWLDQEPRNDVEVWESTHAVRALGQVLSLIWVVEQDHDALNE